MKKQTGSQQAAGDNQSTSEQSILKPASGNRSTSEEDILKHFQALDANDSGVISRDDLCGVLQELDEMTWSSEKLDELMETVEANDDGSIDYFKFVNWFSNRPADINWTEFKPAALSAPDMEVGSLGSEDWCRWRFRRWDLLGRGFIMFGEFGHMLSKYYPLGLPMADLREVFEFVSSGCKSSSMREAWSSSTAKITPDDFVKWIVRYKGKGCYSVAQGIVTIPLKDHISFVLGGHALDRVIISNCAEVRRGWRVISFTASAHKIQGDTVGPMLQTAIEGKRADIVVEFDVEDLIAWKRRGVQMGGSELSERQEVAFVQLTALLESEFGIPSVPDSAGLRPDMEALTKLSPDLKKKIVQNVDVMNLIIGAKAVHELDALLGQRSLEELQLASKLLKSIENNDVASATACVDAGANLLYLDNSGNAPIHRARSASMASVLAKAEPGALDIKNQDGRTPLQSIVGRLRLEARLVGSLVKGKLHTALSLDKNGVSACMQMQGDARQHFESQVAPWEEMERALHTASPLTSLEALTPKGHWQELLAFHVFGEPIAWAKGLHTDQSRARLLTLWGVVDGLFETLNSRSSKQCPAALKAAKQLLQATKGPLVMQDARSPYRDQLTRAMARLSRQSDAILNSFHGGLSGEAAEWLRHLENWFSSSLAHEPLADHGVKVPQRVRMDFSLSTRVESLELPRWVMEKDVDFATVFADLHSVGAVQEGERGCPNDAAYQFLNLAFGEGGVGFGCEDLQHDAAIARCFAGWLRGICQRHQVDIRDSVRSAVESVGADLEQNFYARSEAKGILRISEKTSEEIVDVLRQLREGGAVLTADIRRLLKRSAAVANDINGCTLTLETPEQLKLAYELLLKMQPLAMKNRFNKYSSGYMDVKLLVPVKTADGPLVTEIQLLFSHAFAEKEFMHLPYEYYRGSLDWPHVARALSPPSEGAIGHCPEGHPLKALGETPGRAWLCDKMGEPVGCKSAVERFRCDECDYDLCKSCYDSDVREGHCPAGHRLQVLGRAELRDWICDGRHKEDGCNTSMRFVWAGNRFCCEECDYDLCQMCLLAQLDDPG